MKTKNLAILTSILFVLSIFVYLGENRRGTDLVAGSDYVKGLDVNKLHKIALSFKGDKKIILTRDANKFILENYKSYPASSEKVNDLIFKIAGIQVWEKVGKADEDSLEKYGLNEKKRQYFIELFDNDNKRTVAFSVGRRYKNKGNYLYKQGAEDVYLAKDNIGLSSSHFNLINKALVEIKKDQIEKIQINSDKEISIVKNDKEFTLEKPKVKKAKKEKIDEYVKSLSQINFKDYYAITDSEVSHLKFSKELKVQLKSKLAYDFSLAKKKDKHFVKVIAKVNEMQKKFVVNKDDDKEKLQEIENAVEAQTSAQRFNINRASWIYEIDKNSYEKLLKESKFFL